MKLEFDEKNNKWIELPKGSDEGIFINAKLKQKLDNIKMLQKKDYDCCFVIDGKERIGKSTLGITCAWYLSDKKFKIENICTGASDAIEKLETLPDKSVLMVDEGSLVFNSKDAMTKEQKKLGKIMNVIGQKNMIFIIILPSFFGLNKQIAIERSRFLLHCYSDKQLNRGRFCYFSEKKKKILYKLGKRDFESYKKPKSDWVGTFTNFNPFGQEYLDTKKKSLFESLHQEINKSEKQIKGEFMREIVFNMEQFPFEKEFDVEKRVTQKKKAQIIGFNIQTYRDMLSELRNTGFTPKDFVHSHS